MTQGPLPTGSSELDRSIGPGGELSIPESEASGVSVPARLDDELIDAGASGTVEVGETCELVVVVPEETLGFARDSSELSEAGEHILERLAAEFAGATLIVVEGHASSEGEAAYNLSLSEARAQAVQALMTSIDGYLGIEIQAVGRGEESPIASNETEAGRQDNRRVEIRGEVEREECSTGEEGS